MPTSIFDPNNDWIMCLMNEVLHKQDARQNNPNQNKQANPKHAAHKQSKNYKSYIKTVMQAFLS